jgi:hypothetical protein
MKSKKPRERKPRAPKIPSARAMKAFAKGFTPEQWDSCCENASFRDALLTNIEEARTIAVRLLSPQSTKRALDVQDYYDGY